MANKIRKLLTGNLELPEPISKTDHRRVHFKIPREITRAIERSMLNEEYGLRGKTRWIIEALEQFVDPEQTPYRYQQIIECAGLRKKESAHTLLIPSQLWVKAWKEGINAALFGANTEPPDYIDPAVPGVCLAAIIQRLFREGQMKRDNILE